MEQENVEKLQTEVPKISQKDAVFTFVKDALVELGKVVAEGDKLVIYVSKDVRKIVRARLYAGFKSGQIKLKKPKEDSKLKKYCSGLIKHWMTNDTRFN